MFIDSISSTELSAFLQRKVEGVSFASAGASLFDLASLKTITLLLSIAPLCIIMPYHALSILNL